MDFFSLQICYHTIKCSNMAVSRLKKFCCLFLLLVILTPLLFAKPPKKTVKVAFVPIEGMQVIDTDGSPKGYMYEYFKQLELRANWDIQYIPMTWTEALAALKSGEIDFSGMLPKVPELEGIFYFSKNHTGLSDSSIFIRDDDNRFFYNDPLSLNNRTIGLVKGGLTEKDIDNLCKIHNITITKKYYTQSQDILNALKNKEIDAGANVTYQNAPNIKIIHHFESTPLYICTSIKNSELIEELESAFENLLLFHPDYNSLLHSYYFLGESQKQIVLTREEQSFINKNPIINAVYKANWIPIEFTNKDGEFDGAVRKVFNKISLITGLKFNFIPISSKEEATQALQSGSAYINTAFDNSLQTAELFGINVTKPYYTIPMEKISNPKVKENISTFTYGSIDPENLDQLKSLTNIVLKDTNEKCLESVRKGEAKTIYLNSTIRKYLFQTGNFSKLDVSFQNDRKTILYVGISNSAPAELYTILEKALLSILPSEISDYFDEASRMSPPMTLSLFMKRYTVYFVLIILTIIIVGMGISIYVILEHRKTLKAIYYDSNSGIWNGTKFEHEITKKLNNTKSKYALVNMNISRFRFINDTYGREKGNEVLKLFAQYIEKNFIQKDENYGILWADYFVLFVKYTSEKELKERFDIFAENFQKIAENTCSFRFVLKAGVAVTDVNHPETFATLLERANHAVNSISDPFESQIIFFNDSMEKQIEELKLVDKNMIQAFKNHEFQPFYQPKYDINTNKICGAEALVRWIHPEKGLIPPIFFLPYFERCGFITELDYYVLECTCQNLRRWIDQGLKPIPVSCNFSRLHAKDDFFPEKVQVIADMYNIPHHLLEIEITESIAMEKMEIVLRHFKKFKEMGFIISIDDFGSGYSSLTLLEQMNIDIIKMDKTFLQSDYSSAREYEILISLIRLARRLGLTVICEGIETSRHVKLLHEAGCFYAQGFYFSKPLPLEDFEKALREDRPPEGFSNAELNRGNGNDEILEELCVCDET